MTKRNLFFTSTNEYEVIQNPDGSLFITADGKNSIENAGLFIKNCGGIQAILSKCKDSTIGIEEYKELSSQGKKKAYEYSEERKAEFRALIEEVCRKRLGYDNIITAAMQDGYRSGSIKLHPEKGWMLYHKNEGWRQVNESNAEVIAFRRKEGLPDYQFHASDSGDFKQRYLTNVQRLNERMQREKKEEDDYKSLLALPVIPATVKNIRILLRYLNTCNWGTWELPELSVGYICLQYDCDGKQATTIQLDSPISDSDECVENETMFVVGNPRGHLTQYRRL